MMTRKAMKDNNGIVMKPKYSMYLVVQETPSSQVAWLSERIS